MPPNGPSQPAGPGAPPPDQGSGGGGAAPLLQSIDKALKHLVQVVSQDKGAPPQAVQLIQGVAQGFDEFMEMVAGGGGEDEGPEPQAQGQTVPPEAGGNKGAIPSPM